MKFYIKKNKILFMLTILTSTVASLGYVFLAILLQQLLDIAMGKNLQQFIKMILFSIAYFAVLCIFHSCSTTCTSILSQSHGR